MCMCLDRMLTTRTPTGIRENTMFHALVYGRHDPPPMKMSPAQPATSQDVKPSKKPASAATSRSPRSPRKSPDATEPGRQSLTPEAWIDAATEVLVDRGIDHVRVDVLATQLGVTRGSFYWHFRDREDLLRRVLEAWRNRQIAGIQDPASMPSVSDLKISDDELRESIETNQLRLMKERGSDITIFSPRASFMAHHIGDFNVSSTWAAICNELCFRVSQLFPDNFIGAAMLPQSPGVDPASCIPELEKCVKQFGNVGINLNPDPSGGLWNSPPLSDRHWFPIYEKMVEYDIPAMIHVSTSCNPCFHTTGAHYLNADTTAFMQCLTSDLFKEFPTLRFLIPHGGGAVPYHWGRFRGLAQELKKPLLSEHLLNNIYFDTCVYHQPGIDLLNTVIPVKNVLFASEMIGAVRGIDPETGNYYDDTKRYIQASKILSDADRFQIYEGNARRVFPRLDAVLKQKGL